MSEKEFWELFLDKHNFIAVHCDTEEKAIKFCKLMDGVGMKWCNGSKYTKFTRWYSYKEQTCYSNKGEYSGIQYYANSDIYTFIEYDDIFTNTLEVDLI